MGTFSKILGVVLENAFILMEADMTVNGKMIRSMAWGLILIPKALYFWGNGNKMRCFYALLDEHQNVFYSKMFTSSKITYPFKWHYND